MVKTSRVVVGLAGVVLAAVIPIAAQSATRTRAQMAASYDAHKGEFDYLLGSWEFTGHNLQLGNIHGYWNITRIAGGEQVIDEFRIISPQGETTYVTTTLRAYDVLHDRWELVSTEKGLGLQDSGTGQWHDGEMHIQQSFLAVDESGKVTSTLWKIRYHDITTDRFLWSADRFSDDGKTWQKNFMTLDVRRRKIR